MAIADSPAPPQEPRRIQRVPKRHLLAPTIFAVAITTMLVWGYRQQQNSALSAETGIGYWLGIVGVTCMVLLLSYPLAKRVRWINRYIAVRHWFRLHMMLGILGPTAILFHCNFQLGSLNSSVALVCMLLVVVSGIVGRYFYSKVHLGLYGQKANSTALLAHARQQQIELHSRFSHFPDLARQIDLLFQKMIPQDPDRVHLGAAMLAAPRRWWARRVFEWHLRKHNEAELHAIWKQTKTSLGSYLDTLRKLAQLRLFERLLSWWHVLHLPIFIMMLITAVIHIWAVHRY